MDGWMDRWIEIRMNGIRCVNKYVDEKYQQ